MRAVLSCCCPVRSRAGCLGDPLVPALPRTANVLSLNHSLRHLRRTRGLEANAREDQGPEPVARRDRPERRPAGQPVTFGWAPSPSHALTLDRGERKPARRPEVTVVVRVEIKF